jgi:hypothetical protein
MAKGIFGTPRNLGLVTETRLGAVRIRFDGDEGDAVAAIVQEGEEIAGVFTPVVEKGLNKKFDDLSATTKTAYNNFVRAILREYNTQEGYTDITVS